MRKTIFIAFPAGQAQTLQRAPAQTLAAVNLRRIRAADHKLAMRCFSDLQRRRCAALWLTRARAENLLAACDAVACAIDDDYIDTPALACAVERFGTFRTLLHLVCSHPSAAGSERAA